MYRVIRGSTSGRSIVPAELAKWFRDCTSEQAERMGFDVSESVLQGVREAFEDEGLQYIGFILAKPEYFDALEESGVGLLDVVSEGDGRNFAAVMVGGRVYEVDAREIQSYL